MGRLYLHLAPLEAAHFDDPTVLLRVIHILQVSRLLGGCRRDPGEILAVKTDPSTQLLFSSLFPFDSIFHDS